MLEIEMKFPVSDFLPIQMTLQDWQAHVDQAFEEIDHYYNAPDRDFVHTDEALRLRRTGATNVVTYKGPRQPGPTKTRTEIEISLESGEAVADKFCLLLTQLGYRPVAIVKKKRLCYHFVREGFALQVCLDELADVGQYAEVEIVAPEEKKRAAQQALVQVAAELGLRNVEKRSYLEMHLLACRSK